MTKQHLCILFFCLAVSVLHAQTDSAKLEKLRSESGVDPTRVQSRVGYSIIYYDQANAAAQLNNRFSLTMGVGRWSLSTKYDVVTRHTGIPGDGFKTGSGDVRFSILNAFYVKGKTALAGSVEFAIPTGKPGFGFQYFSATPSITYSYTINPTLFLAVQPQYTFAIMKDPVYPSLSVLTVRSFLAKFTSAGYFFVFEPRQVVDFTRDQYEIILSPIIGKSLGGGFNLIYLMELPLRKSTRDQIGVTNQLGFNKNF